MGGQRNDEKRTVIISVAVCLLYMLRYVIDTDTDTEFLPRDAL